MANTDFFDDDLVQQRDSAKSIKMGPGAEPAPPGPGGESSSELPHRSVSDLNIGRLARHKDEVEGQVARAAEELELLRQREEDLEREKHALQELRKRQEDYERGKREMIDQLNQHVLTLEKEEVRAGQVCELLGSTRRQFREMLGEIQSITEEEWDDEHFREELAKALAVIEDARMEFQKAVARVKTVTGADQKGGERSAVVYEERSSAGVPEHGFVHWLKVGFAFCLPLILFLAILLGLYVYLRNQALL